MKKCSSDCIPMCDFCKNLQRSENDYGESFCRLKKATVDWLSVCDKFECFLAGGDYYATQA